MIPTRGCPLGLQEVTELARLTLSYVLAGIGQHSLPFPPRPTLVFAAVTNDSREALPGSLFVALRGERDGHDFIADARRRGATGVIAERLIDFHDWLPSAEQTDFAYIVVPDSLAALQNLSSWHLRQHSCRVVGITGSMGKTTTREVVASVLGRRFRVLCSEKNYNNEIGLPLTLLNLEPEHQYAVLEMGMYDVGDIASLCRLAPPQVGIVTNVSYVHLERLGTIDRIAQAKSELVQALPSDGTAILNADDKRVAAMRFLTLATPLLYGLTPEADVWASDLESLGLKGLRFRLHCGSEQLTVFSPLPGWHSVYACLAAASAGLAEGLTLAEVADGLAEVERRPRLVTLPGRNGSVIIDDTYNANPLAVEAGLSLLASLPGRRVAILGDMFELGAYEEEGHRAVGRKAAETVDELIVVGQRARLIGEEARAHGLESVRFFGSNAEVELNLSAGDYVLVKGSRGMRMEEIVARLRAPEGG